VTIEAIHHVNIRAPVADIARLRQFYCEIVGLRDGWRPPFRSRGHWLYAGSQPIVHLVEDTEEDHGGTGRASRGVDHVAFRCADLTPMVERLRRAGIEFQLTPVPALEGEQLLFRDPLGIGVELTTAGAGAASC
jgi:catechol 2,3-dioxygenase-like lactoylglutathione lyase family enzyme